jgi:hypothetical protein
VVNFPAVGALLLLALAACAPLNASTMSERCRGVYDACLNACPKPQQLPPGTPTPPPSLATNWQADIASCTDSCNKQSQSCR